MEDKIDIFEDGRAIIFRKKVRGKLNPIWQAYITTTGSTGRIRKSTGSRDKKRAGFYSHAACYSMHPLKNLNVWGDGGFIVTNKKELAKKLYLIRNHGLKDRNNVEIFGYNSRLDTIQAAVANYKMKFKLDNITKKRIENSKLLDKLLAKNENVILVKREKYSSLHES